MAIIHAGSPIKTANILNTTDGTPTPRPTPNAILSLAFSPPPSSSVSDGEVVVEVPFSVVEEDCDEVLEDVV